jgi:Ni/Fe-hydrogenase subunit HybB-like protein
VASVQYREIEGRSGGYFALLAALVVLILAGLVAAWTMEHQGHHITGMSNRIVWGMPHVFAVFLIVAASGALNVASIASVFGRDLYKPLARLSGLLAVTLLSGGLAVLVLDLGRPERLIVAMTHYNFKSIFAWNIFLYTGFFAVVALYLWTMFERRMNGTSKRAGLLAFLWRLVLTTGTGSIFGFLVAREPYASALLAPLFIVMSFSFGLAIFVLVLMAACQWTRRALGDVVLNRLGNLLGVFAATVLYFVAVQHLTNLYSARQYDV